MTPSFKQILVATDFSAPSLSAIDHAQALAQTFKADLHVVHVFEDPFLAYPGPFEGAGYSPVLREDLLTSAKKQLTEQVARLPQHGLRSSVITATRGVAHSIVDYAQHHHVDLIVVGTHGRSGVSHLLAGSVAERVVRTAACPVLTVHTATPQASSDAVPGKSAVTAA